MKVVESENLYSAELQPLQQLAATKVVIPICESQDVQNMIRSFSKINGSSAKGFSDDQWKQLCTIVRNKLGQIGVPKLIVDVVLKKMWPICFEILKWILCHDADMGIDSSPKFYWTPLFSIDYKKTAEMLVKKETIDIKNRFKLACFYCLEVEVRSLWEVMSLPEKRCYFVRGNLKKSDLNPILLYWAYYIQEVQIDYWNSKTFNLTRLFQYAVKNGYLYATKFFLGKFKSTLRNRMISNCFNIYLIRLYRQRIQDYDLKSSHFVAAYYLITQYNTVHRGHQTPASFFMINLVVRYFLEWPLQKHFMSAFDCLKRFMESTMYTEPLEAIFEKEMGGFKDYDYKTLFMEFWRQMPEEYKTDINTRSKIGFKMFFRFVKKHFRFVFDQHSFTLQAKLRFTILRQDTSEKVSYFDEENVEFLIFLLRERVTTRSSIRNTSNEKYMYTSLGVSDSSNSNIFLGELKYLVDIIEGLHNSSTVINELEK